MRKDRRAFVQRGALLGSGLALLRADAAVAGASEDAGAVAKTANATLGTIHDLHSTHGNFSDRQVPEDALQAVLQASVRAANASNMQSYSIVVVRDPALMKQLCGYAGSRLLLYCVDFNRLKASAAHLGLPYHPDSVEELVTACVNTTLAAQTAVVAARSLGVDSLITNGIHRGDMERVWKLLDLPETLCFPLLAVVLGYATEQPKLRKGRLSGAGSCTKASTIASRSRSSTRWCGSTTIRPSISGSTTPGARRAASTTSSGSSAPGCPATRSPARRRRRCCGC